MDKHALIDVPTRTSAAPVSRRGLIRWCGAGLLGAVAAYLGVGRGSAANAMGARNSAPAAPDPDRRHDICARSDRAYARSCQAAFRRDLEAVEARYQARLARCPEAEGEAAVYRASCERERAHMLERVHAGRREWRAGRAARHTELLRSCGLR
jgi:hypothetical protein